MAPPRRPKTSVSFSTETVPLDDLRPHPRNYREHPPAQIAHLAASLREHGFYRPIVVAKDGTILAGHGVTEAAREAGFTEAPVVRLSIAPGSRRALKIVAADNEVGRLAVTNDRGLDALLRDIRADDPLALLGTGYDDTGLATLQRLIDATNGRVDPAAEWVGMPAFEQHSRNSAYRCVVHFKTDEDADRFFEQLGVEKRSSFWWPESDGHVGSSVADEWVAG